MERRMDIDQEQHIPRGICIKEIDQHPQSKEILNEIHCAVKGTVCRIWGNLLVEMKYSIHNYVFISASSPAIVVFSLA